MTRVELVKRLESIAKQLAREATMHERAMQRDLLRVTADELGAAARHCSQPWADLNVIRGGHQRLAAGTELLVAAMTTRTARVLEKGTPTL